MTILIDGDLLLFRASAAAEQETIWEDNVITLHSSLTGIKYLVKEAVDTYRTKLGRKRKVIIALSHKDNFRKWLYPDYKGHRSGRKPLGYRAAEAWLKETWDTVTLPALEADDVMGIMATSGRYKNPVIVSWDKDMHQIPCSLYNPLTDKLYHNTMDGGHLYHMIQTLTGDKADNYPGCPGYGDVTAEKLLAPLMPHEYWPAVVAAFAKKGLTEDDALLQAKLANILTAKNYRKGTLRLWEPPNSSTVSGAESTSTAPRAKAPKKPKAASTTTGKPQKKDTTPKGSSTKARPTTATTRSRAKPKTTQRTRSTTSGSKSPRPSTSKRTNSAGAKGT